MVKVEISFDNRDAAWHFLNYLEGQGEQDYLVWMAEMETKFTGNITALTFNYNLPELRAKGFCGRLDDI